MEIISGSVSFLGQFGDHFRVGDHFGVRIISGSVSFLGQFGDHFRVGDHFGVRIISGAVQTLPNPLIEDMNE